jgi:uncharacterized protein
MSVSLKDLYRQSLQLSPEDRRRLAEFLLNPPPPRTVRQILDTLEAHVFDLRRMGVERMGLFGSIVHGEADPASDIDILVRLGQSSFRNFMQVKFYLEDLLGQPVDLVLEEALREKLRPTVLSEAVYVQGL